MPQEANSSYLLLSYLMLKYPYGYFKLGKGRKYYSR